MPQRAGPGGAHRAESVSHPLPILGVVDTQLELIDQTPAYWRLDERTRDIGRRGVESARVAIEDARRAALSEHRAKAA